MALLSMYSLGVLLLLLVLAAAEDLFFNHEKCLNFCARFRPLYGEDHCQGTRTGGCRVSCPSEKNGIRDTFDSDPQACRFTCSDCGCSIFNHVANCPDPSIAPPTTTEFGKSFDEKSKTVFIIIGSVIGGLIFLCCCVGGIICCCLMRSGRNRRRIQPIAAAAPAPAVSYYTPQHSQGQVAYNMQQSQGQAGYGQQQQQPPMQGGYDQVQPQGQVGYVQAQQ